jgi:hypothetical protein
MFSQDSAAVLDYHVDWTNWLQIDNNTGMFDTITASTFTADPGILIATSPAPSFTPAVTTVWLSGGTSGQFYKITNHVTTSAGRQVTRVFTVLIAAGTGDSDRTVAVMAQL